MLRTKPPPFAVPARHLAAVDLDPLADADQAVARGCRSRPRPRRRRGPRLRTSSGEYPSVTSALARAAACLSTFVRPSWTIRYAERSIARRERDGFALDVQLDRQARAPHLVEQRLEAVEAGLGGQLDLARRRCASRRAGGASRASAVRPVSSTPRSASPSSASARAACAGPRPTWSTITLIAWATMSCSSRAIRARSSATAIRAAASRSRSA